MLAELPNKPLQQTIAHPGLTAQRRLCGQAHQPAELPWFAMKSPTPGPALAAERPIR